MGNVLDHIAFCIGARERVQIARENLLLRAQAQKYVQETPDISPTRAAQLLFLDNFIFRDIQPQVPAGYSYTLPPKTMASLFIPEVFVQNDLPKRGP